MRIRSRGFRVSSFVLPAISPGLCASLSKSPSPVSQRSSRYFTQFLEIPPLSTSSYGSSLPVCYTNSPRSLEEWLDDHILTTTEDSGMVVGFDIETVPVVPWFEANFEGPAVVQISTCKGAIVVHLVDVLDCDKSKETIPMLKSLLADQTIVKAGVGIDQDMIELYRDWGNEGEIRSRFDIGGIGGEVGRTSSLKDLAKAFLGVDLPKSKRLSRSNWSRLPLSEKQIAYCARDAWAAAAILFELAKRKPELFSSRAIQQLLEGEFPIAHLEKRSVDRKAAKKRFLQLIEVSQETRTPEMREEINKLREAMNQLAPPNPFFFGPELSGENSLR